jgi:LPS O-antigen subunit length determinant protein (WzzB/FepE family)
MKQSNQNPYPYQTDEIDINLGKLFNSLIAKKLFIFGLTGFVTLLAIIYANNLTPTYKSSTAFKSPSENSIININKLGLIIESKNSIFSDYLVFLSSQELQKKVFLDGGYITVLNPENGPIDNVEEYANSFTSSIELEIPVTKNPSNQVGVSLFEKPHKISMTGTDAKVISRYLNELVVRANHENISAIKSKINQNIGFG